MRTLALTGTALGLALAAAACRETGRGARSAATGGLTVAAAPSSAPPEALPARFIPLAPDETVTFGLEPDGRTRLLVGALRVVTSTDGGIAVAESRLPEAARTTIALPERLGGGFLFLVAGQSLYRAETWLGDATPIFTSPQAITKVLPGLDRVYVGTQGGFVAIDARTGARRDLGPFPASPSVAAYGAADGWRALAIADLRGVIATFDAGATWQSVDIPGAPRDVSVSGDELLVETNTGRSTYFSVRADGSVAKAEGRAGAAKPSSREPPRALGDPTHEAHQAHPFGRRPIVAAVEDGVLLADGTALVARDGKLGRVRLGDGELVEVVHGAFPEEPARCHPVSLARGRDLAAFGFVCGEPRGTTALYAYDRHAGMLTALKRWAAPRAVTASGNGALVVRGPCAENAAGPRDDRASYCILGRDDVFRDVLLDAAPGSRVIALADGRVAVVTPPTTLASAPTFRREGAPARLTVHDRGRSTTVPITFPRVPPDIGRALALGLWLDGFEERRPGVLAGWLEAGGTMLGLEIALDGRATPGQLVRDAGMPFVAGRFGFGFGAARRGYETTDGGMTWKSVEVPEPLTQPGLARSRAVGPLGAMAAGWLRVGWGARAPSVVAAVPAPTRPVSTGFPPQLSLACEPLSTPMPLPLASPPPSSPLPSRPTGAPSPRFHGLLGGSGVTAALAPLPQPAVPMPPFYAQPAPSLRDGDRGMSHEVLDVPDRSARTGALARIYAWGSRHADWDATGRFQVRWVSPFAGWQQVESTTPSSLPPAIIELIRPYGGWMTSGIGLTGVLQIATGDDPRHALLVVKRASRTEVALFELEAGRPPAEVRRADGEPFTDVDGVVRVSGRWVVASTRTVPDRSPPRMTTLWQVEGQQARELVSLPRLVAQGPGAASRLARRFDGRAVGYIVDGQATGERLGTNRWVLPVDLETGQAGTPESLGPPDLAGRSVDACADDSDRGWVLDAPLPGASIRLRTAAGAGSLHGVHARLRLTATTACIEQMTGTYDGQTAERVAELTGPGLVRARSAGALDVIASAALGRYPLRCTRIP